VTSWLAVVSAAFLCYFIVLDAIYATLFAVSFFESGRHMRRLALGGDDIVLHSPLTPPMSIIVPAFNEEACIVESVDALRLIEYGELEIVVVNDGSTDGMLARLTEAYDLVPSLTPVRVQLPSRPITAVYRSRRLPNLIVVTKENGGCKADAINAGVNTARYPLVCVTDADAVLEKDALLRAVRPFLERPRETVAVGGTVRIVNGCTVSAGRVTRLGAPRNLLAALQVVEYMRAFIASRTAWSRLGGLFLISGAFGVFRKDALVEVGGFNPEAIGEDMELVLRMHRTFRAQKRPFRIIFVPDPVVWTEAPESLKGLRSQRKRWHRGLLQCLWWNRRMVLRPSQGVVGMLGLPYLWAFEAGGTVLEVAGYAVIILSAALGELNVQFFALFVLLAMAYGVALSVSALVMDDARSLRTQSVGDIAWLLLCTVIENFGYRQLLALWRFAAMIELVAGRKARWDPVERKGFQAE
jgi:cellulose synthase/poly-beta-1,6-N-acetylglucosamine synthase-like glycosyltransferase